MSSSPVVAWRNTVIDENGRVNVVSFELCVLTQLRERIRAKEIWIEGADRYCNPDDDLSGDFAERRDAYYADLGLSQKAKSFVAGVKAELEKGLRLLNATLPDNDKVPCGGVARTGFPLHRCHRVLSRLVWRL